MAERVTTRTEANLQVALAGEADANRRYLAYGIQALREGRPDIAQLFFEAAGAETIHALNHLQVMNAVASTRENLERAARGEIEEIEVVLPRMIREAEEEGRHDAAASFRLALDRERHHRDMFRAALDSPDAGVPRAACAPSPTPGAVVLPAPPGAGMTSAAMRRDGQAHLVELEREAGRIERLSSIREVVFGAQDGLVSTFAVVAGLVAAGVGPVVVLLGGAVAAIAGVLSMSIGVFMSSRAQRQLYESELARERQEIQDHPGEEVAELIAALTGRGMARPDAVEVARRIARFPELFLHTLATFELGLAPQRLGRPLRDATVMAMAFGGGALVPLVPFAVATGYAALAASAVLTVTALFLVGVLKARVAGVSALRSGLEVAVLAIASATVSFALGRLASIVLGVDLE